MGRSAKFMKKVCKIGPCIIMLTLRCIRSKRPLPPQALRPLSGTLSLLRLPVLRSKRRKPAFALKLRGTRVLQMDPFLAALTMSNSSWAVGNGQRQKPPNSPRIRETEWVTFGTHVKPTCAF